MPIFQYRNRLVHFCHIPKTGGSAIVVAIRGQGARVALNTGRLHGKRQHGFPCSPQHFQSEVMNHLFPEGFFDASIAVVRHPLDRMVSEYRHRMHIKLKNGKKVVRMERWLRAAINKYEKNSYLFDNHLRPQVEFISDNARVFHYEDGLGPAVMELCKALGVPEDPNIAIPRKNQGIDLDVEVTPAVKKIIEERYREDYAAFGY